MKKMSRKNFRGGPLFSSKSSSSSASHEPSSSSTTSSISSPGVNGGIMRRATWADKIRDKLPPLGENEYEVLWERGVLGVIFLESEKDGIPYVSKATESCISPAVGQGDILKYVNVVRSKDHSFSDFFKILATMKKPVLLRFERLSASTPSSDEDETSQLFGVQRSSSTNAVNTASHYARQNVPNPDEGDSTGKFQRANSVPQKDQKPPKATRGAFWRATSAKDSVGQGNPAQSVGPNGVNGGNERMGASQAQRRVPSNRDHQVSPRDAVAANGSMGQLSHSPLAPYEYQVYWETGSLGLFFGEDRATNLPVVTRSTPSANPVVRRAVVINDTLVSANGIKSADYTFEAFFGRLQQMNKPVRLVFRRRQPNDQVVIVRQGEQQQQQRQQQQQLQQQLQQCQQQMREQQEMREQEQKRELHKLRDQQQLEQQQREQQQRELQQREQQQRELQQREQQQLEQQLKQEQQVREQQLRDQQVREQQLREQQLREKQLREQQEREQQQREEQRRQQEAASRNRTPSVTVDTSPSPSASPAEGRTPHRNRTPSPIVKRASTPPPRPPSPQIRLEPTGDHRDHHPADRANMRTPPPSSPVMLRKQEMTENTASINYEVSPKASMSPMIRSSPRVDISPRFGISPNPSPSMGSSPKVSSSPLASPISSFVVAEIAGESSNTTSSPVEQDYDDVPTAPHSSVEEEEDVSPSNESQHIYEKSHGRRSRNSSEEQQQHEPATIAMHDEEQVLSPVNKTTHLSPTEPWDLPEHILSPTIKAEPIDADEDDDVDIDVPVSPSADTHLGLDAMVEEAELPDEAELVEEVEFAEEAELAEEVSFAEEVEVAEEAELAEEAEATEVDEGAEPAVPTHPVDSSSEDDVEVGMLADVEVGIAVEETEAEDAEDVESSASASDQNPWDLEPESDRQKTLHHGSNNASSRKEASSSSSGNSSIDSAVEMPKVDFADASESPDEFSNDPDISSDIDIVDNEIMMREAPKDKVDPSNTPKPSKSSLNANLAKYKKKGKTARGVMKLPALTEEEALTVPLVAPNAVNTTIQVRGRPKPKLSMADTPDSTTYLIKWKENRSIGLQLKEVHFAKGTYPLVMDVCQETCCELLRHICVGDVIIEINGRNTSTMGVKKTVNFLKTCTKTTLMKIRHGPGFVNERVSATV